MIKFSDKMPKYNKAYGFVEVDGYDQKLILTNSYYRLFGLELEGRGLLVTEDADIKCTLRLNNLPWNLHPRHFL